MMKKQTSCLPSMCYRLLLFFCLVTSLAAVSASLHYYTGSDDVRAALERTEAPGFDLREFYRDFRAKKDEELQVRRDFLALLGLKHPPHPQPGIVTSSAPRFLLELYRHLELSDLDQGYSAHDVSGDIVTSALLGNEAVASDMIIAFVNDRGKHHNLIFRRN